MVGMQEHQIQAMDDLLVKFETYKTKWDLELTKNEKKIHSKTFMPEDAKQLKILRKNLNPDESEPLPDSVIETLKEALRNPNVMADDVCNALRNDLLDQQLMRDEHALALSKFNSRFSCRHMDILNNLFSFASRKRDIRMIETMVKHLKYFTKQEKEIRKQIYRKADIVMIPAQTTIFHRGDEGDFMYIILKGLVTVQIWLDHYNISQVVTTLRDGDCFGELALIEMDGKAVRRKRAADCITVEDTWMLRLDQKFCSEIAHRSKSPRRGSHNRSAMQAAS